MYQLRNYRVTNGRSSYYAKQFKPVVSHDILSSRHQYLHTVGSEQLILLPSLLLCDLDRTLITLRLLETLNIRHQLGISRDIDSHTLCALAGHEGETHQDISSGDVLAAEIFTAVWRRGELLFEKPKVRLEVGVEVETFHLADDGACDGSDEEGHFGTGEHCVVSVCLFAVCVRIDETVDGLTADQVVRDEQRHQTALGIVHVESIPQPRLRLGTRTRLALDVLCRNELWRKVLGEVFGDEGGLGDDDGFGQTWGFYGDEGRFADWVHSLELRRSELVGGSLVGFDLVVDFAFFEQPEDALGTGLFKPEVESQL